METAAAIHPPAKQNGASPADSPSAAYLNYDDDSDYGPETDVDRIDEFHPTEQKRDLPQEHPEDGVKKPKLEEGEMEDVENQQFDEIDINGNGSDHHDDHLPEVAKQVDDLGASGKVFGQLEENDKSIAGNHQVVHDSISEESETEDEEEVDWKYVKGDKKETEIKEDRNNSKDNSFGPPASSDGGESGDENMEYNLNPDAAEFVPLSPTSGRSTSNSVTDPLSPSTHRGFIEEMHRSHLLNEDDRIVSSSPMKGQERSIDDVDVPSIDDFQSEICRRPSDITPNFVAENVTTPIKRDIFDSTFDKTSDTLLGASTKAVYGDDSDCANLSDFGKSLNGDEHVKMNGDDAHGVSEKELSNYEASDEKETASSGKEEDISPENSTSISLSGEDIRGEGGLDQNGSGSHHPILDFGSAAGSALQHSDNEVGTSNVFGSNPFGNNVASPFQENAGASASQIFGLIDSDFSPEQQEKFLSEEQEKEVGEENCRQKEEVDFFRLDTGFNNAPDFSFGNQKNTNECFAKQLNDFGSSVDHDGSGHRIDKNDVEPEQISGSVSVLDVHPTGDSNPFEERSEHLKASDSLRHAEHSFSSARNKEWKKSIEDFSASLDAKNPPAESVSVNANKHHLKDLVLGSTEDLCTSFDAEAPYVHECSHSEGHKGHRNESVGTQEKEQSGSSIEGRCTSFDAVTPYIHECSDHHSHDLYTDHKPLEEMNATSLCPTLSSPHFATEQKEFIEEGVLDEKENSLPPNVVEDISPGMSRSSSAESVRENDIEEAEINATASKGLEEDRTIVSKLEEGVKTAESVSETSPVVEVPKLEENAEMSVTGHEEDTPRISTPPPTPAAVEEEEESKTLNQESLQSFVESPKVSALGIEETEVSFAPLQEGSDNKTMATVAAIATTAAIATGAVLAAKTESKKIASKPSIKKAEADKAKPSKPAPRTTPSPAPKAPVKPGKPSTPSTSVMRKAPSPATKPTATKSAPRPASTSASNAKPPVTKNVPSRISAAASGRPKSAEPAAIAAKPISKTLSAPRTRPISATVALKPAAADGKPALNGDVSKSTPKVSSLIKKSPLSKTPVTPKPPAAAKPSPKPAVSLTSRTSLAPALKPKSPVVASKTTPSASKPKVASTNVLAPKKPSLTASVEKKATPPRKPLMRPATRPAAEAAKPVKKMAGSATAVAIRKPASYINQMKNGDVKTNGEVLADTKGNDVEAVK